MNAICFPIETMFPVFSSALFLGQPHAPKMVLSPNAGQGQRATTQPIV